jgi:hypothetical protein
MSKVGVIIWIAVLEVFHVWMWFVDDVKGLNAGVDACIRVWFNVSAKRRLYIYKGWGNVKYVCVEECLELGVYQ